MKLHSPNPSFRLLTLMAALVATAVSATAALVTVQAESGTLGSGWTTGVDGTNTYITVTATGAGNNPGSAARVASYTVTFPEAGTYKLYARVWVGSGAANDDSFFYANGFGSKSATADADWILENNLSTCGFTAPTDVVSGNGSAGSQVWKWVCLSDFNGGETPISFTVPAGNLTQTFQIGGREDGLSIDKMAFGISGSTFTVANLDAGSGGSAPPDAGSCIVNWTDVHQHIDGFGASSAWRASWTAAQADMFFTTNTGTAQASDGSSFSFVGIGLSLLRNHINPDGTTVETNLMIMAQARGARVWSTPWSPPAAMKSNTNVNNGGTLLTGSYQAYANQLANYVLNMKNTYGVNLYAISVQNEPDQTTAYESCIFSGQQLHDFIPYLYNALSNNGVASTRIVIPESYHWSFTLDTETMNDANTASKVSVLAGHSYGTEASAIDNHGKAAWQTEDSFLSGADDHSIVDGLVWAVQIHKFMTIAEANAWHYWWLITGNQNPNEGLCDVNWVPAKRFYTMGNFSRFVRPDYFRITVNNSAETSISAYKDSGSSNFAVVAINTNASAQTKTFYLTNFPNVTVVTPWITSAGLSLAVQPSVGVTNQIFSYTLPASSVVTFAGNANSAPPANTPPTLVPVSDRVINPGATLAITNMASDADIPSQTLTFSLLAGPTNATVNSATGVLLWRPLLRQADSTNPVTVQVADAGTPVLTATNNFTVTVNPLTPSSLSVVGAPGGQITLSFNGLTGPDYEVLTSTNLVDWESVLTLYSPALPYTLMTNVTAEPMRVYRLRLGP